MPADSAWGVVWLHGNWRYLTTKMTPGERDRAAAAVERWNFSLGEEPILHLRWWEEE